MAVRAPDWTEDELEAVLSAYAQLWETLRVTVPDRTPGAIAYIRPGVHAWHQGQPTTYLSERLKRALQQRRRQAVCPECGVQF
jgi:hypothetical protein